ncbi:thiamine phosphate synthase [Thiolapillus brandeum]|uniref:Thiamine-phosphate synthase n=1 Tax=Thiolapillus brandeum TaxID=1076588 RepID=A0A7U6GGE8_9GAMM|nr:thiamine phosphate synthase [Thiolapillus brandeum]BAO43152.1 thiamine-phosphate pyrophosphorylase [Thiolapillus brandeum]
MHRLSGLYAITPRNLHGPALLEQVEALLRGGCRILQYRDKSQDREQRLNQARDLGTLCRKYQALLIINDDTDLCQASGAQGVHLGEDDMSLEQARALLGPEAVIGISCYNDMERAHQASAQGADYVAFGAVFPSSTKPLARRAGLELLRQARKELSLPLVAIGGITPENAPSVIETGVDMLAMIQGLFAQPDPEKAARRIDQTFKAFRGNP